MSNRPGQTRIAHFEILCRKYLSNEGKPLCELPDIASDKTLLISVYRLMVLTRIFDEKAIALQRTGRLGTYASVLGQEAIGASLSYCMSDEDVLAPSFREHGAQIGRGVTMEELLLYWGGDERGSKFSCNNKDFPTCIPVGSQFPHAVGGALAMSLKDTGGVCVAIGGEGSTSKGDFYEALNMAGVWQLPVLFVIINNGWAISVPRRTQSHSNTLAQKAIAASIHSEVIDGNDALAVLAATKDALTSIRAGDGPRLIEAVTYRLGDHTTADDARRYRDEKDVSRHWKDDPIARLRRYLTDYGAWTKEDEQSLLSDTRKSVEASAAAYLTSEIEHPAAMFEHLFDTLPPCLHAQRARLSATKVIGDD